MPIVMNTPESLRYQKGDIYLGLAKKKWFPVGISTDRGIITVAGPRSGKGVCLIIPNLLRWPHNALVIDPKGEAAEATAAFRSDTLGQEIRVIDPFHSANVEAHFRASFNPLASLDPESFTIGEDIKVIADGLVMRPDPQAAHWDDGAASIIAGIIAHLVSADQPDKCNLIEVRRILRDGKLFDQTIDEMAKNEACDGLPQAGAGKAWAKEGGYFVSNAQKNTEWLDSKAMKGVLSNSDFALSDLKSKPCTVYLVLPAEYIKTHGRFLRLFVRTAQDAMAKKISGQLKGRKCLFILDEFFALGYIDEIATSAGLMPGYGLHLWPFLQDIGQLMDTYGKTGAATFFAGSDIHIFFGVRDMDTANFFSEMMGRISANEAGSPRAVYSGSGDEEAQKRAQAEISARNAAQQQQIGQAYISPQKLIEYTSKYPNEDVARTFLATIHGGHTLLIEPDPYFREKGDWETRQKEITAKKADKTGLIATIVTAVLFFLIIHGPNVAWFYYIAAGVLATIIGLSIAEFLKWNNGR